MEQLISMPSLPAVYPTIYVYEVEGLEDHKGYLKIGYTDRADVNERIREQTHTAALAPKVVLKECAMRPDGSVILDKEVHRILLRKGFAQLNAGEDRNEWFRCTVKDVKAALCEAKSGKPNEEDRFETFSMRPEQFSAVEKTLDYFRRAKAEEPGKAPKFLWNAKMRFGKTFATYQLAKQAGFRRVLVLTFKPAVESAWASDLRTHMDFVGWQFVSNKDAQGNGINIDQEYENADKGRPIVVFGSFQDLLGVNASGGIKAKNEFIHSVNWDLVVLDEYHYGAWRDKSQRLFETPDEEKEIDFNPEEYRSKDALDALDESFLPITTEHYLFLSGTPFRALNSGEFIEEQIYSWTYTDEQRAKATWDSRKGENPYRFLPKMRMLTYKLPEEIRTVAEAGEFNEFDLNEFFSARVEKGKDISTATFKWEREVSKWLHLIRGSYLPAAKDDLKLGQDKRPPMPFSDIRLLHALQHTLWLLPDVASCYAMKNLLQQDRFFRDYAVVCCAGPRAGIGLAALGPVKAAMGGKGADPLNTHTITLSCGKLTTGVTVPPWTGVFMLKNLQSPESYFQTAFRVQSPWTIPGEDGERVSRKEECYVFDFALERALKQIADYSCRLKVGEDNPEAKVAEFISFLPVLAYDGASMKQISAQEVLDITLSGTSATLLARRWESALLVNVDNDTLKRLMENQDAYNALMRIEGFRSLNEDITTIINKSEKVKKAKKSGGNLSPKEKRELSGDEKEYKEKRKQIQQKLIKFATRIPIFMYLTDYREKCLKDVVTQLEPQLFKRVTGLEVADFEMLCTMNLFNANLMNDAIFKFKRYEDASLSYAGPGMHEGKDVGGWDTVLRQEEYRKLFYRQQRSMVKEDSASFDDEEAPAGSLVAEESAAYRDRSEEESQAPATPSAVSFSAPSVGSIVFHETLGQGTVKRIDKRGKYICVNFPSCGERRFLLLESFRKGVLRSKE